MICLKDHMREKYEREDGYDWECFLESVGEKPPAYGYVRMPSVSYSDIVETFGYEVVAEQTAGSYQGEEFVLFRDTGRCYGFLSYSYGSCSGCDRLQGCETWEELERLQRELFDGIQWLGEADSAARWFVERDWEGDCSWYYRKELREFCQKVFAVLERTPPKGFWERFDEGYDD